MLENPGLAKDWDFFVFSALTCAAYDSFLTSYPIFVTIKKMA